MRVPFVAENSKIMTNNEQPKRKKKKNFKETFENSPVLHFKCKPHIYNRIPFLDVLGNDNSHNFKDIVTSKNEDSTLNRSFSQ